MSTNEQIHHTEDIIIDGQLHQIVEPKEGPMYLLWVQAGQKVYSKDAGDLDLDASTATGRRMLDEAGFTYHITDPERNGD